MLRELGLVVQVATFCQVSLGGEAAGGVVVAFAVAVPPVVGMPDRNMGGGAWSERAVCAGARGPHGWGHADIKSSGVAHSGGCHAGIGWPDFGGGYHCGGGSQGIELTDIDRGVILPVSGCPIAS